MKKTLLYLGFGLIFNTSIGYVTSLLEPTASLWENVVFAQCVGLTCIIIGLSLKRLCRGKLNPLVALLLSLPISIGLGTTLAFYAIGRGGWDHPEALHSVVIGLFFALIGSALYGLHDRIEVEANERKLLQSESERREIEVHLRLLQAQIEPHFLFNTLANVGSLIDGNPQLAKKLLERLNDWLRVALARARSNSATLGDELDMLENYLEIMKIRFGERLRWHIEVPEEARLSVFPPMLLQPLVENALRHGIEPKVGGGEIGIRAHVEKGALRVEVSDSGVGLSNLASVHCTGMTNIRARLKALFGDAGGLKLSGNTQGGATAILTLPRSETSS